MRCENQKQKTGKSEMNEKKKEKRKEKKENIKKMWNCDKHDDDSTSHSYNKSVGSKDTRQIQRKNHTEREAERESEREREKERERERERERKRERGTHRVRRSDMILTCDHVRTREL